MYTCRGVLADVSEDTNGTTPDELANELDAAGLGPAGFAAVGSVLLALYYYYVRGDKQRGQFIGLWPATILGIASYLKLRGVEQHLGDD